MERDTPNKGTAIGQVRGLGSAQRGAHHWHLMHLTSAGAFVTCAYLVISFLLLPDLSYGSVRPWIAQPLTGFGLALLIVAVFRHTQLGLQMLVEDYVHGAARYATMLAINLLLFAGAAFGLLSLLRLVLGDAA